MRKKRKQKTENYSIILIYFILLLYKKLSLYSDYFYGAIYCFHCINILEILYAFE